LGHSIVKCARMGNTDVALPGRIPDIGIVAPHNSGVNVMGPIGEDYPCWHGGIVALQNSAGHPQYWPCCALARMGDCGVWATVRMGNSTGDMN